VRAAVYGDTKKNENTNKEKLSDINSADENK
jgi:hypothetical protein